jgi:hypothetical protein
MNKECRGCYLYRLTILTPEQESMGSCQHDKLNCPCKKCLVKVVCDFTIDSLDCPEYINFNKKYNLNKFWVELGEEEWARVNKMRK